MPLIQTFLAEHRDVKIDLRLDDSFIDLVERGIDVAARIGELPDSGLIARQIGISRRELVAHRSYLRGLPKGIKAPKSPDDLDRHNCIVYTEASMRNAWRFTAGAGAGDPAGTSRTVKVDGNLQTDSSEVIRASVLAGMGIGYAPTWLFDAEIASGEVLRILPQWSVPSPIHLVSPQERLHSAKVRAFVEHVAKSGSPKRAPVQ